MMRLSHINIVAVILVLISVLSCRKIKYEADVTAPLVFFSGEEVDNDLYRGKTSAGSIIIGIQSEQRERDGRFGNEYWSPFDYKACMETLAKELRARTSGIDRVYYSTAAINSSLVYCDGEVRITCDKELLGVPPGENVAHLFLLRRTRRFRINSPRLVLIPMSEENEVEPANTFFREGDCIPQSFVLSHSSEIKEELVDCSLTIEIPVLKELLHTFVKECVSGNPNATLQYEKDTLHATIEY